MAINERIREERERAGMTQVTLSAAVGKALRTVSAWESGNTNPNAEDLAIFDDLGMDITYIVTGRKQHAVENSILEDEYIYIPVYDIEVSAGHGREPKDPPCRKKHAFRKRWADYHGYNPKELIIVKAVGDSMGAVVQNGDFLVVNKARNQPVNGKIFVIRVRNELKVKYIETRLNGDLVLRSANDFYSDEVLTPSILEAEDIEIIGEVVHGSRDF